MRRRDYRSSEGDELFLTFEGLCSRGLGGGAENRGLQPMKKNSRKKSNVSEVGEEYDEQNAPLYALLRLRFNDDPHAPASTFPELDGCALIRELHVYGLVAPSRKIKDESDPKVQHTGHGRRLMAEAERLALERGYSKIAVIAGIGVRNYYRKLGYELKGLFMVKDLSKVKYASQSPVVSFGSSEVNESTISLWEGVRVSSTTVGVLGSAVLVGGLAAIWLYKRIKQ